MIRTYKSKKSSKPQRSLKRSSKRSSKKQSSKKKLSKRLSKHRSTYSLSLIPNNRLYQKMHSFWQIIFENQKIKIDTIDFVGTICESKKLYSSSSLYLYDQILNKLDKYKIDKIKFMNAEYDKSMKYITYALEECDTVDKFLSSIKLIKPVNTYDCTNIIEIIDNLLYNNLQKYTFVISTIVQQLVNLILI